MIGMISGVGAAELLIIFFALPFIFFQPVCIGLIAKKLGYDPWLMGVLYFIPLVNLVVLGVLAFSETRKIV